MTNRDENAARPESAEVRLLAAATNASEYCLQVVLRFLVVAEAPACARLESATMEAIREKLKWNGPQQYLLDPIAEAFEHGQKSIQAAPYGCWRKVPPEFTTQANSIDPWANTFHHLSLSILMSLRDELAQVQAFQLSYQASLARGELRYAILDQIQNRWVYRDVDHAYLAARLHAEHRAIARRLPENESITVLIGHIRRLIKPWTGQPLQRDPTAATLRAAGVKCSNADLTEALRIMSESGEIDFKRRQSRKNS